MTETLSTGSLFGAAARQAASLRRVDHRPWPLPAGRWLQAQTWENLLFAHWRLPDAAVRKLVPTGLHLDTFDGSAWLGVTPFRVSGLRLRGMLPMPRLSTFLELNVRTYVTYGGKPGIFFFSLDAESALAVEAARRLYKLPYFRALMSARRLGPTVEFSSARREGPARPFVFQARYRPAGLVSEAEPGSLEYFLAERYCLYTLDERARICRAEIHHPRWPLQPAVADIEVTSMAAPGLTIPDEQPLLHFARRQDVVIWALLPVEGPGSVNEQPGPLAA